MNKKVGDRRQSDDNTPGLIGGEGLQKEKAYGFKKRQARRYRKQKESRTREKGDRKPARSKAKTDEGGGRGGIVVDASGKQRRGVTTGAC